MRPEEVMVAIRFGRCLFSVPPTSFPVKSNMSIYRGLEIHSEADGNHGTTPLEGNLDAQGT